MLRRSLLLICLIPAVVACSSGGGYPLGPAGGVPSGALRSISPRPGSPSVPAVSQPVSGEVPAAIMAKASADLAGRTGLDPATFTVVRAEPVQWPDASLGCPVPGMMYAQVVTPGYRIVFEAGGRQYDYRATKTGVIRLCEPTLPKPSV